MSSQKNADAQVARLLDGYFIDGDYRESIQIEYRYEHNNRNNVFSFYTSIRQIVYQEVDYKFFGGLALILDQLPETSAIMIPHRVSILRENIKSVVVLEEWLYPFKEPTGTVVYQLKLLIKDNPIETKRHFAFGSAAEELRKRLADDIRICICYFCKNLVEYNESGGTDYRHDQLYCFRDNEVTLHELLKVYPKLRGYESLLMQGTPDMDAIHSCAAFVYRESPRP
jgi:hypothetical protein